LIEEKKNPDYYDNSGLFNNDNVATMSYTSHDWEW